MLEVERCCTAWLRFDAQKRHGVEPEYFCAQVVDRTYDVPGNDLLGGGGWVEPIEGRLSGLEEMQVDPPAAFSIDALDFAGGAPTARLAHLRIGIAGIDSTRDVSAATELLGNLVRDEGCSPRIVDGWQLRPILLVDLHHGVYAGVVFVRAKRQEKVGAFSGMQWHEIAGDYAMVFPGHVNHVEIFLFRA